MCSDLTHQESVLYVIETHHSCFLTSVHLTSHLILHIAPQRGEPLFLGDYITTITPRSRPCSLTLRSSQPLCHFHAMLHRRLHQRPRAAGLHHSPFSHCSNEHNACFKVFFTLTQSITFKTARSTHSIVHNLLTDVFRTRHNVCPLYDGRSELCLIAVINGKTSSDCPSTILLAL